MQIERWKTLKKKIQFSSVTTVESVKKKISSNSILNLLLSSRFPYSHIFYRGRDDENMRKWKKYMFAWPKYTKKIFLVEWNLIVVLFCNVPSRREHNKIFCVKFLSHYFRGGEKKSEQKYRNEFSNERKCWEKMENTWENKKYFFHSHPE